MGKNPSGRFVLTGERVSRLCAYVAIHSLRDTSAEVTL